MNKALLYPTFFAAGFCALPVLFGLFEAGCKVLDGVEWLIARVRRGGAR